MIQCDSWTHCKRYYIKRIKVFKCENVKELLVIRVWTARLKFNERAALIRLHYFSPQRWVGVVWVMLSFPVSEVYIRSSISGLSNILCLFLAAHNWRHHYTKECKLWKQGKKHKNLLRKSFQIVASECK